MKVIKEKVWEWEFDCTTCGSTCLAEISDVEKWVDLKWDYFCEHYFVKCGGCGCTNIVPKKKLTCEVKKRPE